VSLTLASSTVSGRPAKLGMLAESAIRTTSDDAKAEKDLEAIFEIMKRRG
jgi:hypothetical protein